MADFIRENLFSHRGAVASLTTISAFILIIAIATTGWIQLPGTGGRFELGLWEICACGDINDDESFSGAELDATRAMVIIGTFLLIASVLLSLLFMCVESLQGSKFLYINGLILIGSIVCLIIGVAVYGDKFGADLLGKNYFHYSFGFTIVSMFFNLFAIGFIFLQIRQTG